MKPKTPGMPISRRIQTKLARFDDAPNLIVELRTQPTEIGNG